MIDPFKALQFLEDTAVFPPGLTVRPIMTSNEGGGGMAGVAILRNGRVIYDECLQFHSEDMRDWADAQCCLSVLGRLMAHGVNRMIADAGDGEDPKDIPGLMM